VGVSTAGAGRERERLQTDGGFCSFLAPFLLLNAPSPPLPSPTLPTGSRLASLPLVLRVSAVTQATT